MHAPGRNSPVAEVQFVDGKKDKIIAVEGLMVGQDINVDGTVNLTPGSIMPLANTPRVPSSTTWSPGRATAASS